MTWSKRKRRGKVGNAEKRPIYKDKQNFPFPNGCEEEDFRRNTVARRVGER